MITVSPLHAAISAHRAAYDAFQIAPEGEDSECASCEMLDALDALVMAACAFPIIGRPLPEGAGALLAHLQWWLAEEAVNAVDYEPAFSVLLGRASDLAAVLDPPTMDENDPIISAIVAADMAALTHTIALVHRDENDDESEAVVDAAAGSRDDAFRAVQQAMPGTLSALLTLVRYYERDCKIYDATGNGEGYLGHVAAALALFVAREGQAPLSLTGDAIREASGVPGRAQVVASWHALPSEVQNRIGVIATDMVFQAFVHGDSFVAAGQPKDRAVPGRSKAHQAIRDAAGDAETERLSELHRVVEAAIPALFGPDGQNPSWAVAMGARR